MTDPFSNRSTDREGALAWLGKPPTNLRVSVLYLFTIGVFVLVLFTLTRVVRDEHSTCMIQARGLPVSHQLADAMTDIHELLTVAPRARSPQAPPAVLAVVGDLNMHLAKYQMLEAKQPQSRRC